MNRLLLFTFSFSLFAGILPMNLFAQHITVPIHYSQWIPNYALSDTLQNVTSLSKIPIAFFMKEANGKTVQYEKLEIGISLPAEIKTQIAGFIRNGRGINPFDPGQISIKAIFSHVERHKKENHTFENINYDYRDIFAFYYEEFHHEMNDERFRHGYWKRDTTSYNFRIRFAPDKTGWWSCTINILIENQLKFTLPAFDFLCVPGNSNGFINSVSENHRFLQFENGNIFFGLGQNIPFADLADPVLPTTNSPFRSQPPQGFILQRSYIEELAKNGGNLVRIMHGEWTDALEWEKLNDYSMNMNFAWEFDQTINLCSEKNIFLLWLQQDHIAFMAKNPYGNDGLAWPSNPYHKYLGLEKPEDFFKSAEAIKKYKHKIRYMLSRWGYSRMIAGIQPMSEINEMAANITDHPVHHPYFNDTSFRNVMGKWFLEIKNYIQQDLGYDFLVGSSFTGDVNAHVGDDPVMRLADFNDYHPYGQNRNRNIGNRFGGINITPGYGIFKRYKKPVIIGEMGTWDTEYLHQCHENEFHNDIWGTAFLGGWSTGLHWHNWEDNYDKNLRNNFSGISNFIQAIDFTNMNWTPSRWPDKNIYDSTYSEKRNDYFEATFLMGKKKFSKATQVVGWVHNRSAYWYNYPENDCEKELTNKKTKDTKGKKYYRPDDDDVTGFTKYEGEKNKSKRVFKIGKLKSMSYFNISWFNTVTGEKIAEQKKIHGFGKMKIEIPDEINNQKYQDLGFMIKKNKK